MRDVLGGNGGAASYLVVVLLSARRGVLLEANFKTSFAAIRLLGISPRL